MTKNTLKAALKAIAVILLLTMEIMAGLLQFHSHDCAGHAKFSPQTLFSCVGCNHNHAADMPHSEDGQCGENESGKCGLHLDQCNMADTPYKIQPICVHSWDSVLFNDDNGTQNPVETKLPEQIQRHPNPIIIYIGMSDLQRGSPIPASISV